MGALKAFKNKLFKMKQTIFTFLFLTFFGLAACKKDKIQQTIKQYDQTQILNYIAAHNLTGFVRDTVGGDTTGIYYKIITPGNGARLTYSMQVPMVYSYGSFDGKFTSSDTINNHFYDYLGHIQLLGMPLGLQTALVNDLKYNGGTIRVLIPSHLAYGLNGSGSGSSQVANNRIAGNQCLDYYAHLINNFPVYDDMVIQNYMKDSSLVGYTKVESKLDSLNSPLDPKNYYYYKVLTPGTGTDYITDASTVTVTYTGQTFNATIFDNYNTTGGYPLEVGQLTEGVKEALENYALTDTKISILVPSSLAYGLNVQSGIPIFSCLRFTFVVVSVSP